MEIPLLITKTDIKELRPISKGVTDKVINPFIQEAQLLDLQDLLGIEFYDDLLLKFTETNYKTLLDGGLYEYGGTDYSNVGLRVVLVHYAHARYLKFGSVTDTPFSLVEKLNENSQPVSEKTKQILYKGNQQIAFKYWRSVQTFLNRKSDDYPLWKSGCVNVNQSFKISKIT